MALQPGALLLSTTVTCQNGHERTWNWLVGTGGDGLDISTVGRMGPPCGCPTFGIGQGFTRAGPITVHETIPKEIKA